MANKNQLRASIQLRYDIEADWLKVADTYVPLAGEPCVTIDGEYKGQIKIGDGFSPWGELKYLGSFDELKNYTTVEEFNSYKREITQFFEAEKFEIFSAPSHTLVNIEQNEIRIMCPKSTQWEKQNVGANGNPNMYYIGFKAYAPNDAASFKESESGTVKDEMLYFEGDFAGIDEFNRKYSIVWLPVAEYNEGTDSWTYYGENSSTKKYIGWNYVVEWYDEGGSIIAEDKIRINLADESCYNTNEPYYMSSISINKLVQDEGDYLTLYGGSATDNI